MMNQNLIDFIAEADICLGDNGFEEPHSFEVVCGSRIQGQVNNQLHF